MTLRRSALLALVLSGCTTVTVVPEEDGLGGADSSSTSSSSSATGTGAAGGGPACEATWDWDVALPLAPEGVPVGLLALGLEEGALQLLSARNVNAGYEVSTTRVVVGGEAPVLSDPVLRGVLPYLTNYGRWTALPNGGFELHEAPHLMEIPMGDGPAVTTTLEQNARVVWDVNGGRYLVSHGAAVEVHAPDGVVHVLGESCSVIPHSSVGDGVLMRLGDSCSDEYDEPRTYFIGADGFSSEVDLTSVGWFGRGAGGRALGVGFLQHIVDIGAEGELGDLVVESPWDGNNPSRVRLLPWLDGFAAVSMDQYAGDQRGVKVRAYPGYGARVESPLLETGVAPWEDSFTAAVDPTSGGLVVAYRDQHGARLARLSCTAVGP